jgi:predicted RNase H-like nuclease
VRDEEPGPVRLVGADLAWGHRGGSGLAVLDEAGSLLALGRVRTDDEIDDWIRHEAPGPCLVAIDAPLVVRNPTGRRECERLVARHFGRTGAVCHPTNLANPRFADGGRGWALTRRLGLDLSGDAGAARRAVEVYPHAALVELFELPTVLRYKAKPGRDRESLRSETLRLADLVESLAAAAVPARVAEHPGWRSTRAEVAATPTKARLAALQDVLDAVVCAYVALLHHRAPHRTRALGTAADGLLVTPVRPATAARIDAEAAAG